MEKSPEELYQERVKRLLDVAALKTPDRVPIMGAVQGFPYFNAGVTIKEIMNDYDLARKCCHKFVGH